MPTFWGRSVRLLAIAAMLCACKGRDGSGGKSGTADEGKTSEEAGDLNSAVQVLGTTDPTLTLLLPGEEPLRDITYRAVRGARSVRLEIESTGSDTPSGAAITIELVVALQRPGKGQGNPRPFRVVEAHIDAGSPPPAPDEQAAIDAVAGMFAKVEGYLSVIDPHYIRVVQTAGARTAPSLALLLHELVVPLPTLPFGKGARWSVLQPTSTADGMTGIDTRMYEVAELSDDGAVVKMAGTLVYGVKPKQEPGSDNAPHGPSATVHGELHLDFSDAVPVSGEITIEERGPAPARPSGVERDAQAPKETAPHSVVHVRLSPL